MLIVLAALATILAATEAKNPEIKKLSIRSKLSIWIAVAISVCSIFIIFDESKDSDSMQGKAIVRALSAAKSSMHALDLTVVTLGSYDSKNRESAEPKFYIVEHERAEEEISEILATYSDALSGEQRESLIDIKALISRIVSIGNEIDIQRAGSQMMFLDSESKQLCKLTEPELFWFGLLCDDLNDYYSKGGYWAVIQKQNLYKSKDKNNSK